MKLIPLIFIFFSFYANAQNSTVLSANRYPVLHYSISEEYPFRANVTVMPPAVPCLAEAKKDKTVENSLGEKEEKNEDEENDTNYPIENHHTTVTISAADAELIRLQKLEEERLMAQRGSTSFTDIDEFFNSIIDEPEPNCGYRLGGRRSPYPRSAADQFCAAMNDLAHDRPVSAESRCHISNCTTASYLAIIQTMQTRSDWDEKKHLFECTSLWPAAYDKYKGPNGLLAFAQEYDLGASRRMPLIGPEARGKTKSQILQDFFADGFPRKSDPVLLQRLPTSSFPSGSGHAVIFSHFETADGEEYSSETSRPISKVCYWSSNGSTSGAGTRCEGIEIMQSLHTAQLRQ